MPTLLAPDIAQVALAPVDEFVAFVLDQRRLVDFLGRQRTRLTSAVLSPPWMIFSAGLKPRGSVAGPYALSRDLRGSLFLYAGFTGRVRTVFLFPAPF